MNNSDRELVEKAAVVFGFGDPEGRFTWTESEYCGSRGALWNYVGHCDTAELWNPLTSNADAFCLATKLNIVYDHCSAFVRARAGEISSYSSVGDDLYSSIRRVIVNVASQLGDQK